MFNCDIFFSNLTCKSNIPNCYDYSLLFLDTCEDIGYIKKYVFEEVPHSAILGWCQQHVC